MSKSRMGHFSAGDGHMAILVMDHAAHIGAMRAWG